MSYFKPNPVSAQQLTTSYKTTFEQHYAMYAMSENNNVSVPECGLFLTKLFLIGSSYDRIKMNMGTLVLIIQPRNGTQQFHLKRDVNLMIDKVTIQDVEYTSSVGTAMLEKMLNMNATTFADAYMSASSQQDLFITFRVIVDNIAILNIDFGILQRDTEVTILQKMKTLFGTQNIIV